MKRIIFGLPLSHIVVYLDTDIVYCIPYHVVCIGVHRCIIPALLFSVFNNIIASHVYNNEVSLHNKYKLLLVNLTWCCPLQYLSAQQYYLLGWSDGGATAMILAARYPDKVRKLIIWGANAYVTEEDMELYEKLRDISNWSERMRSSMEQMYGLERLQELWNAWLDSMKRYLTERQGMSSICVSCSGSGCHCPNLVKPKSLQLE